MTALTIILSDEMMHWVDETVGAGLYPDPNAYLLDLIQQDRNRRAAVAEMQRHVDEGLASGISPSSMEDILQSVRAAAE